MEKLKHINNIIENWIFILVFVVVFGCSQSESEDEKSYGEGGQLESDFLKIVKIVPSDGSTDIDTGIGRIEVIFSKNIKLETIKTQLFKLSDGDKDIKGSATWGFPRRDAIRFNINDSLSFNKQYKFEVLYGITDYSGNSLDKEYEFNFSTINNPTSPPYELSNIKYISTTNEILFFSANTSKYGNEAWMYNGNSLTMISDINTGSRDSFISGFKFFNDKLFAIASSGSGEMLMHLDYENSSFNRVFWIDEGYASSSRNTMSIFNKKLHFFADQNGICCSLFEIDEAETIKSVGFIDGGSVVPSPRSLTEYNGKLYFSVHNSESGRELWVYDGLTNPYMLVDLYTGTYEFFDNQYGNDSYPHSFVVFKNKLYFSAKNEEYGREIGVIDEDSTPELAFDINVGSRSSNPIDLTIFKNALYFSAEGSSSTGNEFWKYDGSNDASIVEDMRLGEDDSNPGSFVVYNNKLYFSATIDEDGYKFWEYNGTDSPIELPFSSVIEPNPNFAQKTMRSTVFDNKLFFTAFFNDKDSTLWVYDGINDPYLLSQSVIQ